MTLSVAPPSIITYLIGRQREASLLFAQLEKLHEARTQDAGDLVQQLIVGLVKTSVVQEIHLFPFVRDRLAGGDEIADRQIAALGEAEQTMKDLEELSPGDNAFWPTVTRLRAQIDGIVWEQEFTLFPLLQRTCSNEELVALAERARTSAMVAPTRPHPDSPKEGTALQLLAPGVGLVDRLRDLFTGRGT